MNQYFTDLSGDELSQKILQRVDNYSQYILQMGYAKMWKKSYNAYYNSIRQGGEINTNGYNNEFATMNINQFESLLKSLHTLTTASAPAFDAIGVNDDYTTRIQTQLANLLLDYYTNQKDLKSIFETATFTALLYGEAFVTTTWNPNDGEVITVDENDKEIQEGDLEFAVYSPYDCIRDFTLKNDKDNKWYIIRRYENKYDLATIFTEQADVIIGQDSSPTTHSFVYDMRYTSQVNAALSAIQQDCDNIITYTLYHIKTKSCPNGKEVKILQDGTLLYDVPLPYETGPVYRISVGEIENTIFANSIAFSMLALQEGYDNLNSTILTNQKNFGVQSILIPDGCDVSSEEISNGCNVIKYNKDMGEPKALQLTSTAPETFDYIANLKNEMETISGVNSVVRGNPDASLKSGAALALIQNQAIQYNNYLQQSYNKLIESVGTAVIIILRTFADTERVAAIVGKDNRNNLSSFTTGDLQNVNRVAVKQANPLSKTLSGRLNTAEQLLASGLIKTPEQYITVLETGRLEPLLKSAQSQLDLIQKENEMLMDGRQPVAIITDNHSQHIQEHAVVINDPTIRSNPTIVQMTLNHIQEHIDLAKNQDPVMAAMLKVDSFNQGQPPELSQGNNPETPLQQEANSVNQPNLPSAPAGTNPVVEQQINENMANLQQ